MLLDLVEFGFNAFRASNSTKKKHRTIEGSNYYSLLTEDEKRAVRGESVENHESSDDYIDIEIRGCCKVNLDIYID